MGRLALVDIMATDTDECNRHLRNLLEQKHDYFGECNYRHRNGTYVPVEVAASPVHLANKRLVMVNVRDTTERKHAEVQTLLAAKVFENTAEAIVIQGPNGERRTFSKQGDRP